MANSIVMRRLFKMVPKWTVGNTDQMKIMAKGNMMNQLFKMAPM
jgi:hypothetical protein